MFGIALALIALIFLALILRGAFAMQPALLSRLRKALLGIRPPRRKPDPLTPQARQLLARRLPVIVYQALADEKGTTLYVMGAVEEVLGYTARSWLERPDGWYRALHPDDRKRVMNELAQMASGESRELTYRIRHQSGEWRWIRDTVSLFNDAAGVSYYLGVMTDITRERALERSQTEARRFFEALLHSGPWMLYHLEGERLRIRYVTPNLEDITGADQPGIVGREMAELAEYVHPDDLRLFSRHLDLVRQLGRDHCRIRLRFAPGDYRWLDLHTQRMQEDPEIYFGYALDVNEQIRNETFLRRYLEQQRELNELGSYAWETTEPHAFFDRAIEVIDKVLRPEFVAILEYVAPDGELRVSAGKRIPAGIRLSLVNTQAGYTFRREEPVVAHDLPAEDRFVIPRAVLEMGITSTLSVPIPGLEEPYGVLGIGYKNHLRIDETTIGFVQSVAQLIGQVQRQRRMLDDLEHKAYFDDLTELPNRRALYRRLSRVLSDPTQGGMVAFLDLVDFGEVNDTWGHEVGDQLLRQAAERLRGGEGWAARWGGDEFVLVITNAEPLQTLRRTLARLAQPLSLRGRMTQLRARAGVVYFRRHGADTETLFRRADAALSAAKEKNREVFEYYPGLEREALERRSLVEALREALERREGLYLNFQPIVRVCGGELVAAEALLRWRHPQSGKLVPPAVFVPLAERYGLSAALDRRVLEMALRTGMSWLERLGEKAPAVSVNVSPESFAEIRFVGELRALLAHTGFSPQRLLLEITERVLADSERTRPVLAALRKLGVAVTVDDFGTGYSSLAYLAHLGIDGLKVDRAFIRDIGRNRRTEAVLRSIFALGDNLGVEVTAEGVEEAAQLDWLKHESCNLAQGYYLGRPMDATAFEDWLLRRTGQDSGKD